VSKGTFNDAKCAVGMCFANGQGLPENFDTTVSNWAEAAVAGHAAPQLHLGLASLHGRYGVPQDLKQAERWLYKAAEQGNIYATYELGYIYAEYSETKGRASGERAKYAKAALEIFQKIAEVDHPAASGALRNLGVCYSKEAGGLKMDLRRAEECWQKAIALDAVEWPAYLSEEIADQEVSSSHASD
jgi:TPR repeat protein